MTKATKLQITTAQLAVLINRSVRTARRFAAKSANARKVSGKWVIELSAREIMAVKANAVELARFVAKEVRDQQCGTASEDLQESLDRSVSMLQIIGASGLAPQVVRMVAHHNPKEVIAA
jgi:H+/gluconate symporter-like permease